MDSFPSLEPVSSMSGSNCCFLTCIQVSQEAGQVVWCSHLLKDFPQFVMTHTVKGFSVVNEAEEDVFLEFSCFSYDPTDVGSVDDRCWQSLSRIYFLSFIWSTDDTFHNLSCYAYVSLHTLLTGAHNPFVRELSNIFLILTVPRDIITSGGVTTSSLGGISPPRSALKFGHWTESLLAQRSVQWRHEFIQILINDSSAEGRPGSQCFQLMILKAVWPGVAGTRAPGPALQKPEPVRRLCMQRQWDGSHAGPAALWSGRAFRPHRHTPRFGQVETGSCGKKNTFILIIFWLLPFLFLYILYTDIYF